MAKAKKKREEIKRQLARRAVAMRGSVTLVIPPWDHGATGQANRIGLVVEERGEVNPATGKVTNPNRVTGVRRVDLLAFWWGRGTISTGGYNAAVALRNAYDDTLRGPPALPENDRVQSSPKPDQSIDIRITRISRFSTLMRRVADEDREIVSACVLDGHHPSRVYGALRTKDGFQHLRDALDRLHAAIGG